MLQDKSGAMVLLPIEEHMNNHGFLFSVTDQDVDVDIATPKLWRVATPAAGEIHLRIQITASAAVVIQVSENPTVSTAGTGLTELNRNRRSDKTTEVTTFKDTTVSGDGTVLEVRRGGTPFLGKFEKIITKISEDYLIKVTAVADNTVVEFNAVWFDGS